MSHAVTSLSLESVANPDATTSWERLSDRLRVGIMCVATGLLLISCLLDRMSPEGRNDTGTFVRLVAALLAAFPVLMQLLRQLQSHATDSFTDQLVTLAVLGAIVSGEFTTAVLVPVFMDAAHLLEQRGIPGTQSAINGLKRLTSRTATLVDAEGEHFVAPDQIRAGQFLLVRPGDMLVADGLVVEGVGAIDESSLTGESTPRDVGIGEVVLAGTVNIDGLLKIQVSRTGDDTSIGNIRRMLAAAMQSKSPLTQSVERYAELYVPVVVLLAALVFFLTRDMHRVITVFVVSCPCALVLSGPATMIAALASATRHGILIKNTRFLDTLADAETVIFDKTGTVTVGELAFVDSRPADGIDSRELIAKGVSCAMASRHPVSQAIARYAAESRISANCDCGDVVEVSGRGIERRQSHSIVRLGRPEWLAECGVKIDELPSHGGPVVGIAENDRFLGFVLLADQLRPETAEVLADLRAFGINRIVLVTGDRAASAEQVARQLMVDELLSDAFPEDKLSAVHRERERSGSVIVVGDGINDSLALAAGHVGIAMGARGCDIAIQSADIALLTNDLRRVPFAMRLARKARRLIAQNVGIALCSSSVMFGLGAIALLTPLSGALLHNIGTALVLLNSSRILKM